MTVIEFFDSTHAENIVSTLLLKPDRVIFVGNNKKKINKNIDIYREIAKARNINAEFSCVPIRKNNLLSIVSSLTYIVENNSECVFDLAGGDDLCLVAVGIVAARFPERVRLHRFSIKNSAGLEGDGKDKPTLPEEAQLLVDENIKIYTGKLLGESGFSGKWDFNREFRQDVVALWEVCRENPKEWNVLCTALGGDKSADSPTLDFRSPVSKRLNTTILEKMRDKNLIYNFIEDDRTVSFSYKNPQIKKSVSKAGQVLELYITLKMSEITDENGNPLYNDVQTGVIIDWDGFDDDNDSAAVTNEIDVAAMKGFVPVFISCKNGDVNSDELYKLSTVADRFGGIHARKVLIVSDLKGINHNYKHIKARADEMGIRLIDDAALLSENELVRTLRSLWIG